jgi:signal transduction histidine kinase
VGQIQTLVERGQRTRALALSEGASRALAERIEATLDALTESMHADVLKAQAEVARLEARTWSGVLVAFGAAIGLALLGSGLIAHRLTQSLETLSAATAAVAAGSFEEQIVVDSKDEIGELARSFNTMARELRRMEETKEEFFASVSHELRSPLTSIREGAHLLGERVSGTLTDKQRRLVEIIAAGSDRLLGLVNQILEVSRLRAGVLPIQRVRLDLDKVVTRAVDELKPTADQTGVSLEREKLGEDFWLSGDEERLLQIVVNLVGNAIRFTKRGGSVVVRLVSTGSELEIQVEDTGIGIPVGELPYVFEPYRQAHADRGGTGLGLAIVRGVAQAHGGRVTVESQEGKGSRFTVLLPRA